MACIDVIRVFCARSWIGKKAGVCAALAFILSVHSRSAGVSDAAPKD